MTDVHTPAQRSYNMSRVRSKDTKPELIVRKFLQSIEPKLGASATLLHWSDRHAYTIVKVKKSYVLVTRDLAERTDQNFEKGPQEYTYQIDPDATPVRANLRKDGKYYIGDQVLKIGYRNEHYDYSF